ncbi:MAG TPA: glutamine-hydrolyzing carbamoyl-phosphate synthase small subunit, partial [Verrucomicrobiae bacterium]|nr:glutamine-hydrolyzing carbamoyl-phosphate synthase small subunit [Verrucomicrobiae bacterium]
MELYLVLEDGTYFPGRSFGATGEPRGEVVFNTSMTGYQEILTDPSYCGQIVVLTYPLIGNYGANSEDFEAPKPAAQALVVREICAVPGSWRQDESMDGFCQRSGVSGICGVDTRALTRHLRDKGTMRGIITKDLDQGVSWSEGARREPILPAGLVEKVTTKEPYHIPGKGPLIAVLDYGIKQNILRTAHDQGCRMAVLPATSSAEDILALKPQGLLLSNGPGDPKNVPYAIETIRSLLGKLPIFGICLGHQLLALALGADTFKLTFGHRGGNHPVQDLKTGRVYITSQNHGYAVKEETLNGLPVEITHRNLNDGTVEGIRHTELPAFSVQYHPEAAPGP